MTLAVVGFVLTVVAFVGIFRSYKESQAQARAIAALRSRYGLDRQRWAQVRRAVHRGTAAPDPLRRAGRAYAQALLDAPGYGAGSGWLALGMVGVLVGSTGSLLDARSHGALVWPTVAGMVVLASALGLHVVLRRRRPARARAALAASE